MFVGLDLMFLVSQRTADCRLQDGIWVRCYSKTEITKIRIITKAKSWF